MEIPERANPKENGQTSCKAKLGTRLPLFDYMVCRKLGEGLGKKINLSFYATLKEVKHCKSYLKPKLGA